MPFQRALKTNDLQKSIEMAQSIKDSKDVNFMPLCSKCWASPVPLSLVEKFLIHGHGFRTTINLFRRTLKTYGNYVRKNMYSERS